MDANLDDAATGVVQSAFGFQGQKCSACSRAIIDAKVYDEMVEKIVDRTAKLKLAAPNDPSTNMSAVINEKAFKTINSYIEKGKSEGGRVVIGGGSDGDDAINGGTGTDIVYGGNDNSTGGDGIDGLDTITITDGTSGDVANGGSMGGGIDSPADVLIGDPGDTLNQ